jgi:uncharacterized protein (DUF2237 family)
MEEQIPPSQPPMQQTLEGQITPEMLAEMKARAMELAIQQTAPFRTCRNAAASCVCAAQFNRGRIAVGTIAFLWNCNRNSRALVLGY